jgi:hypothetical protein
MMAWLAALALAFPIPSPDEAPVPFDGLSVGDFQAGPEGLRLTRPAGGPLQLWLGPTELADGAIRAQVILGKKPDFTLIFRASTPGDDPRRLSALGLSLEGDQLVLYRWEEGQVRPVSAPVPVPGIRQRRALELVISLNGPLVVATAWDADLLTPLGAVAGTDHARWQGRVGWRVHPDQGPDTVLAQLSVLPAGPTGPTQTPRADRFGTTRLVQLAPQDLGRVPADLQRLVKVREPERVLLETDPVGLERIRRAGVEPVWVGDDTPWWVRDERYRAWRGRSVVQGGVDLSRSYKDPAMVEEILRTWARDHQDVARLAELGRTHQGRPILGMRISDNPEKDEDEPAVLLVSAHHGGELLAIEYALDAMQRILEGRKTDARIRRWVEDLELWFVPLTNPDGNAFYLEQSTDSDRKNGRDLDGDGVREPWEGVDLNRNYPFAWGELGERGSSSAPANSKYRGPSAGSEPETVALTTLADRRCPVAVLSWHTPANALLVPYTVEGRDAALADDAWKFAEKLAAAAGKQPSGRPLKVLRNLYAVDGTDQDWHHFAHGSLALLVEGSHHNPLDPSLAAASVRGLRPVLDLTLEAARSGDRLTVHLRDAKGQPVKGTVTLLEPAAREGEAWPVRSSDGRFDLLLAEPRRLTFALSAPGYRPEERTVEVRGPTAVEVELKKK